MRARSWLMIVAVFVVASSMPLCATTALSTPSDAGVSMATNVFADFEQEAPSWVIGGFTEQTEFTNAVLSEGRSATELTDGSLTLEGAGPVPPDQARGEARVPEPASLVFIGTGLIGIYKLVRRKPDWTLRTVATRIRETTSQEA